MKIVRRRLKEGAVIGRHIVITRHEKEGYYARYVGEKSEFYLTETLDNYADIPIVPCKVSITEFEKLKTAIQFSHIWAPTWRRIYNEKPSIIKFWAPNCGCMYIWVSLIKKRVVNKAPSIYIEITSRCYESLD